VIKKKSGYKNLKLYIYVCVCVCARACVCALYVYVAGKWWKKEIDQIPKVYDQNISENVKITILWSDFSEESKRFDQIS